MGLRVFRATILSGTALSEEIDIGEVQDIALQIPATWTAASITFAASADSQGTYGPVYDDTGAEVTLASANVVASRMIALKSLRDVMAPLRYIKLRSGTSAVPVNQAADRGIVVLMG
jgi:hypothetical protein